MKKILILSFVLSACVSTSQNKKGVSASPTPKPLIWPQITLPESPNSHQ